MFRSIRFIALLALCIACLVVAARKARAQSPDPSGHWVGAIHVPDREVPIEIDLAKSGRSFRGAFSNATRNVKGFPLSGVSIDGKTVRFTLKATNGGGRFESTIADDASSMSGKFYTSTPQGDYAIPFTLSRDGAARFEAPLKSPALAPAYEGTWTGTLTADGTSTPLTLSLRNQAGGSVGAFILSKDSVEVPIASISVNAGVLALDVKSTGSSFRGSLNAAGTSLAGTWIEGSVRIPLVLERSKAAAPVR